jgi:hypothetical protein
MGGDGRADPFQQDREYDSHRKGRMNGVDLIKQAKEAGFNDDEIGEGVAQLRQKATDAGFGQGEIDTFFGEPPFDPTPVKQLVQENIKKATKPEGESTEPKPVNSFIDALEYGLQMSVSGLLARGKVPDKQLTEDAPMASRVVSGMATMAGDLPFMVGGALVGRMPGAFALPTALRKIYVDKLEKGEATTWGEFWERASGTLIETGKSWLTGYFTAGAGNLVKAAPIVSPTAKSVATVTSEVATMVTVGKALEGEIPQARDFLDAAVVIFGVKGAMKGAAKLRKIYAETGVKPADLVSDMEKDPTILQDVLAENVETPKAYEAAIEINAAGGGQEPPKPPPPPAPPKEPDNPLYAKHITKQTPQEIVLSRISIGGSEPKEKMTLEQFYTMAVDDLNPIQEFVKEVTAGKPIAALKNTYERARRSRGSFGRANQMLEHATYDFKTNENNGPALKEILKPVKKDLNGIRAYGVSKRVIELEGRGVKTGVNLDAAKAVVKEDAAKYEPIFRELVAYQNRVSKHLLDSGVITKEVYDAMLDANKEFVPFFRVMDDGAPGGAKLGGGITVRNPIKRMEGSERIIVDPLESIVKNTYLYASMAERNMVLKSFVDLAMTSTQTGKYLRKVPAPVRQIQLHEDEIQALFDEFVTIKKKSSHERTETSKTTTGDGAAPDSKAFTMVKDRVMEALKARGFSDGEATQMISRLMAKEASSSTVEKVITDMKKTEYVPEIDIRLPNDVATVFRTAREPLKDNEIGFFNKGKWEVYEVDKDVASAFKSLDAESANLIVKILAIPARTLRAGAVLSPDFMGRNMIRDQAMAFTLSKSGYVPFIDLMRGFTSIMKKEEYFQEWLKGGGAQSTFAAMDREYLRDSLNSLTKDAGLGTRAWNVVKSPLDMLRIMSELAENATRVGVFKQARQHGATIEEAAFTAREGTLDFQRIGSKMRAANMIATFLNAHVQGLDRVARGFHDDPFGMTMRAGISITVPSLLLWMNNREDPRWKEIPQWQKDLFWIVMTEDHIYRIPKAHELGLVFGTIPERLMEAMVSENPDAFKDLSKTLLQTFIPNMIPSGTVPVIEQFANRSLFTDAPVVPSDLEKLLPEYQYTDYTTETSKALGRIMGSFPGLTERAISDEEPLIGGTVRALSSPILVENYVRAWTGGLGTYVLQLADKGLREAGVLPDPVKPASTLADIPFVKAFVVRYPSATAQSVQDFYDGYYAQQKLVDTWKDRMRAGDLDAMNRVNALDKSALAKIDGIRTVLTMHSKYIRDVDKNPVWTAEEKRQLIDVAYYRMIELAAMGKAQMRAMHKQLNAEP